MTRYKLTPFVNLPFHKKTPLNYYLSTMQSSFATVYVLLARCYPQIKMLQDTNKRLQEYNTSLQQYNSNLQADATKNAETIAKLQKEKNTMVETMNGLKDHANSVKMQLDIAKVKSLLHPVSMLLYWICLQRIILMS